MSEAVEFDRVCHGPARACRNVMYRKWADARIAELERDPPSPGAEFTTEGGYTEATFELDVTVDGEKRGVARVRIVHDPGDPLELYAEARFIREGT